jgi:glutaredoxin
MATPPSRSNSSSRPTHWLRVRRSRISATRRELLRRNSAQTNGHNYNRNMHDVVVFSRKDCHLCEIVKNTLMQVQGEADFQWREVDIDADPELRQKFTDEVPVVFIDGRKAFKYRMKASDFLQVLQGRE